MIRLVLLTGGAQNGRILSRMLSNDGISYTLITIGPPDPTRRGVTRTEYAKRLVRRRLAGAGILRRAWHSFRMPFSAPEHYVGRCNGPRMLNALRTANPEYILMMGGGILSPDAIATARLGILNAHPALLPQVRGVDVIRHSVLKNIPVGVTLHYIDDGIDTGRIVHRWLVPVMESDRIGDLTARADAIGNLAMRWVAHRIATGVPVEAESQGARVPLCRALPRAEAARADGLIVSGAAFQLYQSARVTMAISDADELYEWQRNLPPPTA